VIGSRLPPVVARCVLRDGHRGMRRTVACRELRPRCILRTQDKHKHSKDQNRWQRLSHGFSRRRFSLHRVYSDSGSVERNPGNYALKSDQVTNRKSVCAKLLLYARSQKLWPFCAVNSSFCHTWRKAGSVDLKSKTYSKLRRVPFHPLSPRNSHPTLGFQYD
jgi:hypothetical protein